MIPSTWIEQARDNVYPTVLVTPVTMDVEKDIYIKWENRQRTGSFKIRGAFNKIRTLEEWERQKGLVTASTGNFGQGFALAAQATKTQAHVFVARSASSSKLASMKSLGAILHPVSGEYGLAELEGKKFAYEQQMTWISPYNDIQVIAGQATLGLELIQQIKMDGIKAVLIPVGGGGLIAGVGAVLKDACPHVKIIGVQSEASPYMWALFNQKSQQDVTESESLADGLAGPVEDNSITIPLIRQLVDQILLVSEAEIATTIRFAWEKYGEIIEGSGAVGLAAILSHRWQFTPSIVVVSGGNIDSPLHKSLVEGNR